MNRRHVLTTAVLITILAACTGVHAEEGIELTVYNNDLALVKELRGIDLQRGLGEYSFTGVPERLIPASVHLQSLRDPAGTRVLEQNYRYDLLNRGSLLERYRGQEVKALVDGEWRKVRLLAHGSPAVDSQPIGRILEIDGEIHIEGFILPKLPEELLLEPSLVWLLDSRKSGRHEIELSYLTGGLSWQADYVAVIDDKDTMDLTGWVTLDNRSGMSYRDAKLKLVAGDVNRAPQRHGRGNKGFPMAAMALESERGGFEEEAFFEYHLYSLGRPSTVLDNEQKQVELLNAPDVSAERKYVFRSGSWQEDQQPRAVAVMMEFANDEDSGAGMPLPEGTVRVYQADKSGQLQFAGEDRIPHTPEGERVRLKLGDAFDIRGERKQTDTQRRGREIVSRSFSITLRNHKDTAIAVDIIEDVPAWQEWKLRNASHDYEKRSARQVAFPVAVPAKGSVTVTYTLHTN
jgi:hypothetical protein